MNSSYMYALTHRAQKMCPQPVWWGFRTIPPQDGQMNCCSKRNTKRSVRLVRMASSSHDLMSSEFCRDKPGHSFSSAAMSLTQKQTWESALIKADLSKSSSNTWNNTLQRSNKGSVKQFIILVLQVQYILILAFTISHFSGYYKLG